uniref:phosphatidate phosphatase n=1 Tax=Vombatus ursinus TaxID=29139 RepID=A0A4X2L9U4_VOMUR
MNYVGQLAETVYVTVKELYKGLNPATLSGGIDVLVVKQPDGSFLCSPFHVRFGKLGVLRSREKVVDIEINGEPVDLHMKLGDNGEAFFVQQLETNEVSVPPSSSFPSFLQLPETSQMTPAFPLPFLLKITTPLEKRRRRRKKVKKKNKTVTATPPNSSSEELEGIQNEIILEMKPATELSSTPEPLVGSLPGSLSSEYLTSFKSDSELEIRSSDQNYTRTGSHMQWPWGKLPQVSKWELDFLLRASHSNISTKLLLWEEPIFQKASVHTLAESQTVLQDAEGRPSEATKFYLTARELTATQESLSQDNEESVAENAWRRSSLSDSVSAKEPTAQEGSDPSGQRKENKEPRRTSQHLGPSDIYLEDLPSLSSANATLYFPQSEIGLEARRWSEPGCSQTNLLQATVVEDNNTDQLSDTALEQGNDIELSLCGGLADNRDISTEKFTRYAICYQDLADNPGILDDPNLVVKIGMKHYNWAVAAPMILSLQAFRKSLPKSTIDKLVKEKMPKKSGRWWFSWGLKDATTKEVGTLQAWIPCRQKMDISSVEDDSLVILGAPSPPPQSHIHAFKKSLRLSSEQIRDLNLREGANDVVFSVTTQYQGTCRCHANIYLWNWYDKVVISDIDGTITKSDALGHILPQLGKDWTHQGIIKLYHKIHLNGYKFLYCSARSIGMADLTKRYLRWVNEKGCVLPKGPLLLTPSSLFSALHREVIEKKPEVFKISCLTDIHHLFLPHGDPFFAGFGNRASDVYAYLHVGIPKSRIFTVNPLGELIQELIKNHKTTYERLQETVQLIFPPVKVGPNVELVNPEYSQFCYWRNPLLTLHPKDLTNLN